jgi:EmrB/QacA subfamily drug resistance transporter
VANDVGLRSERGPVLLAVMVATGLVAIDATILATAVPSIVDDLGGFEAFPWLFSAYLIAQAVTVPVYSKLADTLGRKPVMLAGVALFLLGSILCGVAWSMPALIAARALQGLGAGAIQPMAMTIVGDIYSIAERARIQGYLAGVWAVAAVLGPTLGGVFAQFTTWRWIFFVNIPLCLLCAWLFTRNFTERVERRRHRVDYAGALLLTGSLTLLLLGVLEGGVAWDWTSPVSLGVFTGGTLMLVAFVLVERRAAEPVLPLSVLGRRLVLTTSVATLGLGFVLIGLTSFVPTYLEGSLGITPLGAGLTLAALTLGWPVAATLSGRIYLRIGFRSTMLIGAAVLVLAGVGLAAAGPTPSVILVGACCFVAGLGMGWIAAPSIIAAQSSVPWHERAVVTGTNMFARTIGSAVGAAVLGSIANAVIAAQGGDESDPGTVTVASTAVFVASAVAAVLTAVAVALVPRTPVAQQTATALPDAPLPDAPAA